MSAWDCLQSIFSDSGLGFTVEINNLGGKNSLKLYNKALVEVLTARVQDLSQISKMRLEAG